MLDVGRRPVQRRVRRLRRADHLLRPARSGRRRWSSSSATCPIWSTGIGSLQGPRAGTSVFAITRAPFGPNGARLVSVFNWITQVGYETEGLALVVLAGLALAAKAGVHASTGLKVLLIVLAAAIQLVLPLLGHRAMLRVLRMLVPPFVVLFILLAIFTLPKAHLGAGSNADFADGDDRAGAHPLGRRLRLGDERQRLLALPAARCQPATDRVGGRARRLHPLDAAEPARRGGGDRGDVGHRPDLRPPPGLPRLVPGPLPHLRDRAAVRHQQRRPVLLGPDAAGDHPRHPALADGAASTRRSRAS